MFVVRYRISCSRGRLGYVQYILYFHVCCYVFIRMCTYRVLFTPPLLHCVTFMNFVCTRHAHYYFPTGEKSNMIQLQNNILQNHVLQLGDVIISNMDGSVSDITEAEGVSDKLEGQTPVHLLAHPDDYGEGDECTIKNSMPFTLKAPGNTKKQIDFEESSSVSSLSNDLSPSFDQLQERYVSDNDWMVTKIVSKEMDFSSEVHNPDNDQNIDDCNSLPCFGVSRTKSSDLSRDSSFDQNLRTCHLLKSISDSSEETGDPFLTFIINQYKFSRRQLVVGFVIFCLIFIAIIASICMNNLLIPDKGASTLDDMSPNYPTLSDDPKDYQAEYQSMPTRSTNKSPASKSSKSDAVTDAIQSHHPTKNFRKVMPTSKVKHESKFNSNKIDSSIEDPP